MFSRLAVLIFILALNISCDFRSGKRTELLREMATDTIIDYNAVDVYPLFMDCNNCDTSEKQNLCFEMELARRLQKALEENDLGLSEIESDTLTVEILVDATGQISIAEIRRPPSLGHTLPELDTLIYQSIASLPKLVQPALKRGIPVNSMYQLPIVVSSSN